VCCVGCADHVATAYPRFNASLQTAKEDNPSMVYEHCADHEQLEVERYLGWNEMRRCHLDLEVLCETPVVTDIGWRSICEM
jgi:hypothetical protein